MSSLRPPEVFETPRLILRVPRMDDAGTIFEEYAQDEEVTRYLIWRPHKSIDDTRTFLNHAYERWQKGTEYTWAMTLKGKDALIGTIALRINIPKADFGYALARKYWNQGYMTEAAKAVVDWAFAQSEIFRVWAICDVDNIASARVFEKLDFQKEGILRRWLAHTNISNEPRDCFCYSKVK